MRMNSTPSGERKQIGLFGKTNAGKSSLLNAITGQSLAIVSDVKGTTTDPVKKAMELLPLGPVVLTDTPGLDDDGELGQERIRKAKEVLRQIDMVLLVVDANDMDISVEKEMVAEASRREVPVILCINKVDCLSQQAVEKKACDIGKALSIDQETIACISAREHMGISELKKMIANRLTERDENRPLIRDLLSPGDFIVLVVPIDKAAPKGRLILPQQQVIRDALEAGAIPVVCRDSELQKTLEGMGKIPRLVVTDSQVFEQVSKMVSSEIPLTSFSILMARYKGDLRTQVAGAKAIDNISGGDKILISEGCTHHRQCGDIGTEKLPKWIKKYTGKDIAFTFTSGGEFPKDLSQYAMVVHCGGCILPLREMRYRISHGADEHVPITNYGVLIAYMQGILERVTEPLS